MTRQMALDQVRAIESALDRGQIENAVHSFFASYPARSQVDLDARIALFADDVVFEDPVGAAPKVGRADLAEFFLATMRSGIIIHMASERIIVCANEAVSLTKASWGPERQQPAQVSIVHNFWFDAGGRINRLRIFFDEGCVA